MPASKIIVGIDPGVNTGIALWDAAAAKLTGVYSIGICDAMLTVRQMHEEGSLQMVVFEDARLRTWFGTKGKEALQGAGSIKRDCTIWADWLGLLGCPYKSLSPMQKGQKLDADRFQAVTGWDRRTNEHGRDAAMLVFGMRSYVA